MTEKLQGVQSGSVSPSESYRRPADVIKFDEALRAAGIEKTKPVPPKPQDSGGQPPPPSPPPPR